jgi:GntP family gluconate:H+ symporter
MRNALSASVRPIADVLLIIAGGGAFQHVLPDAEECNAIMHSSQKFALSPLLLGWIISMLLSVSTGSATVAIADASGLLGLLAEGGAQRAVAGLVDRLRLIVFQLCEPR